MIERIKGADVVVPSKNTEPILVTDTEKQAESTFYTSNSGSEINKWLENLNQKATALASDNGDRDNIMCRNDFEKYFLNLCKLLPLWAGMNCKLFNVNVDDGTTANMGGHFSDVKNSLRSIIPCSADRFLGEHMELIDGMVIDASQAYVKFVGDSGPNENHSSDSSESHTTENSNSQENCRSVRVRLGVRKNCRKYCCIQSQETKPL